MSSTIRLNEEDFWIFPDMAKFFNKANIVFAGFDRNSGIHTLVYCIPPDLFHNGVESYQHMSTLQYGIFAAC